MLRKCTVEEMAIIIKIINMFHKWVVSVNIIFISRVGRGVRSVLTRLNNSFNFTLYPAHWRVGRGNLVLRHSVPHFLPYSGGIACWVAELNAAPFLLLSKRQNRNNSTNRTHNRPFYASICGAQCNVKKKHKT